MDPDTEFDTDIMILDYTCCKAIHELILRRIAELSGRSQCEETNILSMFDTWKALVAYKHSTRKIPRDLEAKLHLIAFTGLFFFRARKSKWSTTNNLVSLSSPSSPLAAASRSFSATGYMTMLEILKIPKDQQLEDRAEALSLIDLFPDFLSLCSEMSRCGVTMLSSLSLSNGTPPTNTTYVDLLGKYLLQSVLEQYSIFGREASHATQEACGIVMDNSELSKIISTLNNPAKNENDLMGWSLDVGINRYLDLITKPSHGDSLEVHLNRLSQQFPAFDFESMLVIQLQDFLFNLETPVLVKLETGEL